MPFAPKRRGFTLIEMVVVLAITAGLSSFLIIYNRASREYIALSVEAAKIAQVIGRARSYAVSFRTDPSAPATCGYGVTFDLAGQAYSFVRYEGTPCTGIELAGPTVIPLETYRLDPKLRFGAGANVLEAVLFSPPEPKAYLLDANGNELAPPVPVNLEYPGGGGAAVTVEYGGQVSL
jgi:prepilin-type N-terminal cleavage/methylation domain-containing protein